MPGIDVVFDMNEAPWPWPDETFDEVVASHCLEHTRDLLPVLDELWRVCQHGARIHVEAPHFFSSPAAWDDPTHRRPMGPGTFDFFRPGHVYGHQIGRARFITLGVGHSDLYLVWDLAAYKDHDLALLARHVDYGSWRADYEGRVDPSQTFKCPHCGRLISLPPGAVLVAPE
jgi:SAM-dependent methyltransferase